jgi:hypothetical protein
MKYEMMPHMCKRIPHRLLKLGVLLVAASCSDDSRFATGPSGTEEPMEVTERGLEMAANCATNAVVIVAHPDDGLAFIHDNIRYQRAIGNCVHFISLTSRYDGTGDIPDREEGARAMYQVMLDENAPDNTPQHYNSTIDQQYGDSTVHRYFIQGSNYLTLSYYRLKPSTYPSKTPGSLYDKRNNQSLISSLRAFIEYHRPDRVYTLNTAGLLSGIQSCTPPQSTPTVSATECDHYDHVGAAKLAKAAVMSSNVPGKLFEFHAYDMARGKSWGTTGCTSFCAMRDAYLEHDTAATATPWGVFLTSPDMYANTYNNPGSNANLFSLRTIRSKVALNTCIGPQGGSSANLTPIVVVGACVSAPKFTLRKSGELTVVGKCVEAGSSPVAEVRLFIFECGQGPHQQWRYDATTSEFIHQSTGLRMDLFFSRTAPGTPVQVFPSTGGINQDWILG